MKFAAIALVAASLTAGTAVAAERISDVDFIRANRCKGLATSISGVIDPAALNTFIKAETGARPAYVMERADNEFQRAKKEAKSEERRDRLSAELSGPCQAYLDSGSGVAKQAGGSGKDASSVTRQ